jgi:signal transduction histidine kinase
VGTGTCRVDSQMNGAPIEAVVRFSRLASEATSPDQVLALLANVAGEVSCASAAVVLQVTSSGEAALVGSHNLPGAGEFTAEIESLGPELAQELRQALARHYRRPFEQAEVVPLVSGGDVYGALVLLHELAQATDRERMGLVSALADLAAVAADRATYVAELSRSYAELRASREAVSTGEKLRALGEMAAGIAHDLKNILNPLGLQIEVLRRRLARDPASAGQVLGQMEDALALGLQTVDRLRCFARQGREPVAEYLDLNALVATAIEITRPRLRDSPRVRLRHEPGESAMIRVHGAELITAVVNLIVNALDAMSAGGELEVRTGRDSSSGEAWLEVGDSGPGMSAEVQSRVFEPFFTTKDHGTGLGLAMVYGLVQRAGGRADLDSAPGEGARFRLWFPVAEPPALLGT